MNESLSRPESPQKRVDVEVAGRTIERINFMTSFYGCNITALMRNAMAFTRAIIEPKAALDVTVPPEHKDNILLWLRGVYDIDICNGTVESDERITLSFSVSESYHAFVTETTVDGPFDPTEFIEASILLYSQAHTEIPN